MPSRSFQNKKPIINTSSNLPDQVEAAFVSAEAEIDAVYGATPREFILFSGVTTIVSGTPVRIASRSIDLTAFPAQYQGMNRTVRVHAVLEAIGGTATVTVTDISLMVPTLLTNGSLSHATSTPTEIVSSVVPVADSDGSLWLSVPHLYEVALKVDSGPGTVTCSGAWLAVTYE
jgi:hypothetical protein